MDDYIDGLIVEGISRAEKLKTKIKPLQTTHFETLKEDACKLLNQHISSLKSYIGKGHNSNRLNLIKHDLREIDELQNIVFTTLNRCSNDDLLMSDFIERICKEINYPLITPFVSCLSQDYYEIHPDFNLLRVPLLECDFFLHLPDLYHEIAHPIFTNTNSANQKAGWLFHQIKTHFDNMISSDKRNNNGRYVPFYHTYADNWKAWIEEFFCDLFALYTLGPAYAWSHLHLTIKQGGNPYEIEQESSHPNEEARMQILCIGLKNLGFHKEQRNIWKKWEKAMKFLSYTKKASFFKRAYPKKLLEQCAKTVLEVVEDIDCVVISKKQGKIATHLNKAWELFWSNPMTYPEWEAKHSLTKLIV